MRVLILCMLYLASAIIPARAQSFSDIANLSLDRWDGVYAAGDTVRIYADFKEAFPEGVYTILAINNQGVSTDTIKHVAEGRMLLFEQAFDKSVGGMLYVRPVGQDDREQIIGFVVKPEGFRPGFKRPKDFNRFWRKQLRELRSVPLEPKLKEIPIDGADSLSYVCYEVIVPCKDSMPCRGYMAMPRGASRSSLPIYMNAHAAGLRKPGARASIVKAVEMAKRGGGAIAMDINAHGLPDDMPQEYYDELDNGRLKGYSTRIVKDHESFYFRTMFLRMVRGLDFLCSLKEWDGKRVLVQGASQGGGQAVALAGLDKRVKAAVLEVPSMFDIGALEDGRAGWWKFPFEENPVESEAVRKIAPYYDGAYFIRKSKANLFVEIGLIDGACTVDCVCAGLNMAKGKKHVYTYPHRKHSKPEEKYLGEWNEKIVSKRNAFIDSYLKK